ncbi:hypothetical protein KIN20_011770 [Parelaphostrongylus tenuis]|uniref:Uncharacterized protein n=1 Tax=Parelaphostrongylus tenuis TaxID=148309 RepID=A0AAD5MEJ1_PARTN|nr:hypothetical protein KIN20_011770 [Parelaphostrongylus tenuis]
MANTPSDALWRIAAFAIIMLISGRDRWCGENPEKLACIEVETGRQVTYDDLNQLMNKYANYFCVLFNADVKRSACFANIFITTCLTRDNVYCTYAHAIIVSTVGTNNAVLCIT